MLSAGFATVTYLKSRLLPVAATEDDEWDAPIAALGKSVAGKFDRHCNRGFARTVDAVDSFEARASAWVLTRYPVEEISAVAIQAAGQPDEDVADYLWRIFNKSGLLEADTLLGTARETLQVTYTGGYWLDPRDGTAMPAAATPLPDDVLEAWVVQCQHEAESRGLFEAVSLRSQEQDNTPKTAGLTLLPDVVEVLRPYRRFAGN
jgi:hypothetical protein